MAKSGKVAARGVAKPATGGRVGTSKKAPFRGTPAKTAAAAKRSGAHRKSGAYAFGGSGSAITAVTARPKAGQPAKYAPLARPGRGRPRRTGIPTAADMGPALTRYVDPGFYAAGGESTWIGEVATSDPAVRMDLVRHGMPAQAVAALADALDMSRDELTRELALPRATVERKLRDGGHLGQAESERVLGVVHLIAQVRRIVEESGDPTGFDAARWVADWLQTPAPALGGQPPIAYMDTAEGRAVVSHLVAQMQSGAYA